MAIEKAISTWAGYRRQPVMRVWGWLIDRLTPAGTHVHGSLIRAAGRGAARPIMTWLGRMIQRIDSALIREAIHSGS